MKYYHSSRLRARASLAGLLCSTFAVSLVVSLSADIVMAEESRGLDNDAIVIGPQVSEFAKALTKRPSMAALTSGQLDSAIYARMNQFHIRGTQAVILIGDSIVWRGNYGYASVGTEVPVADTTVFTLASVSKTVLSIAIMQLWEKGLIDLDTSVSTYLPFEVENPYYPDSAITIRTILSHVSSINRNDATWISDISYGSDSPWLLQEYLNNYLVPGGPTYSVTNYLPAPPGKFQQYSNYAFSVLALVVEHVTGDSLEKYCRDSIFTPLGMNETSWFLANLRESNVAMPTYYASGQFWGYGHLGLPIYPCGQLRTSSSQLARHLRAFMNYGQVGNVRILDSATVAEIREIQYPGVPDWLGNEPLDFGLGWFRFESDNPGEWIWGHDGSLYGTLTGMYCLPEENFGVIMLQNSSVGGNGIYWLIWDFARDSDHDSVIAGMDNCPSIANSDQSDVDADGIGNACDNCISAPNSNQQDTDLDGYGDACDPDIDNDGVANEVDNCRFVMNAGQEASDTDTLGDACDNCLSVSNDDQTDENHDATGDACDGYVHIHAADLPDTIYSNLYFNYYFRAVGGASPYNWSLLSGDPPLGLVLDAGTSGRLHGVPSFPYEYLFSVRSLDSSDPVKADTVSLRIVVVESQHGFCGDANNSGMINISDVVYLINYIFSGGSAPDPIESGDANCSSLVNISDAVYLINYIFAGGAAPCSACP